MHVKRIAGLEVGATLLVAVAAGSVIWNHFSPNERGVHTAVVEASSTGHGGPAPTPVPVPRVGNCPIFPADNVWNTPIDRLNKDPRANVYVDSIGPAKKVHPDFGSDLNNGIPFSEVPAGTQSVPVTFQYQDDSDGGKYPIPVNPPIEGGAGATGDRHLLLIDEGQCILYELFGTQQQSDGTWAAASGIKMDLTSDVLRAAGKTSADAAGLPIFPGLLRYDEVASGVINHALRFTVPHTQSAYVWPARHQASNNSSQSLPPMGTRMRLRADFDVSKYSKSNQVIMTALKRYGMFLADNGGAMYLSGVPDRRWSDDDLHQLGGMTAQDFETVDESVLQLMPDSARVDANAVSK